MIQNFVYCKKIKIRRNKIHATEILNQLESTQKKLPIVFSVINLKEHVDYQLKIKLVDDEGSIISQLPLIEFQTPQDQSVCTFSFEFVDLKLTKNQILSTKIILNDIELFESTIKVIAVEKT